MQQHRAASAAKLALVLQETAGGSAIFPARGYAIFAASSGTSEHTLATVGARAAKSKSQMNARLAEKAAKNPCTLFAELVSVCSQSFLL
jgi:hypothetical protein